jgi:Asp-tRNA(Asn)/Glu-tRNA(Gln) amidotransferase A subunit family amidase
VEHASISEQAAGEEECLRTILAHDMARHHGEDYDRQAHLMSSHLRGWIETGRQITAAQYEDALGQRQRLIETLESWLSPGSVILTAATVDIAPLRDQGTGSRAPQRLWSLVGFPAATIPAGTSNGLPVGVQLVGAPGKDRLIMDVSSHI